MIKLKRVPQGLEVFSVQLIQFSILISVYLYLLDLQNIMWDGPYMLLMWEGPYVIDRFNLNLRVLKLANVKFCIYFNFWILAHFEMHHAAISLMVLVLNKIGFALVIPYFDISKLGPVFDRISYSVWLSYVFANFTIYESYIASCIYYWCV